VFLGGFVQAEGPSTAQNPLRSGRGKGKGKSKTKNNAKKGGFLAIYSLNLEKKGVFGGGFRLNCVDFMVIFKRKSKNSHH
jgi:hypothetical protein